MNNPVDHDRRGSGSERRVAQRYEAGGTAVVLTWKHGEEYETADATLRDISLSGVSLLSKDAVPSNAPVWFRVRGDDTSDWVAATIVGNSRTGLLGRGPRLIRLRFVQSCPYQVFKKAIEGFSEEYQDTELASGNFHKREWR